MTSWTASSRVALVTGGGQGIGKAIVAQFLNQRWNVILAESDPRAGRLAAKELGQHALFVKTDVARESEVRRCVEQGVRQFGRLDALVNNAGIAGPTMKLFDVAAWDRMLAVDLNGPFFFCKYATPYLRKNKGAIINVASSRAVMSEPHTEGYAAAKGGLVALTHALAISLGPEVRVNAVSPGWIDTSRWKNPKQEPKLRPIDHSQHPVGRVGRPEDIAALVFFLASDQAGFITGQNYIVDGGMTRKMIYEE